MRLVDGRTTPKTRLPRDNWRSGAITGVLQGCSRRFLDASSRGSACLSGTATANCQLAKDGIAGHYLTSCPHLRATHYGVRNPTLHTLTAPGSKRQGGSLKRRYRCVGRDCVTLPRLECHHHPRRTPSGVEKVVQYKAVLPPEESARGIGDQDPAAMVVK